MRFLTRKLSGYEKNNHKTKTFQLQYVMSLIKISQTSIFGDKDLEQKEQWRKEKGHEKRKHLTFF